MPTFKGATFESIGIDDNDPNATTVTFVGVKGQKIEIEIPSSDLLSLNALAGTAIPHAIKKGAEGVTGELSTPVHYCEVGYTPTGHMTLGLTTQNGLHFSFFFESETAKQLLEYIRGAVTALQNLSSSKPTKH